VTSPPPDGWSLKYYFRGASTLDVTADGTGVDYLVTITPANTTGKVAGTYEWTAYAEKGAGAGLERRLFDRGVVVLVPISRRPPPARCSRTKRRWSLRSRPA
jgi:hypothetical protein